jgi:hypothetical protein
LSISLLPEAAAVLLAAVVVEQAVFAQALDFP